MSFFTAVLLSLPVLYYCGSGYNDIIEILGIKPNIYNLDGYNPNIYGPGAYGFPIWFITVSLLS